MTFGVFPVVVKAQYHISLSIGLIFVVVNEKWRIGIIKVKGSR
jgi:hypothetical protein